MSEQPGSNDANKPSDVDQSRSPQELMAGVEARLKKIETKIGGVSAKPTTFDGTWSGAIAAVINSGLFFMVLGGGLLYLAQAKMATNHAGITFVLVVLGVALILYGTGTQGAGELSSSAGYNIAIAGGAGIVAFGVAYGIIEYSPKMRDAFQPERKFVRIFVEGGAGMADIAKYASAFDIDGSAVPAASHGQGAIEVYIPYMPFEIAKTKHNPGDSEKSDAPAQVEAVTDDMGMCPTQENRDALRQLKRDVAFKIVTAHFHRVQYPATTAGAEERSQSFLIRLDENIFGTNDGGVEFPKYPIKFCVALQDIAPDNTTIRQSDSAQIAGQPAGKSKNVPPLEFDPQ